MSDRVQAPHLLDEPPILIYPTLAVAMGINKAIVFQQLHFLLNGQKTARNMYNYINGRWWVYNSYPEWQRDYFPWLSIRTLKSIFISLEVEKLVLSMQSVKNKSDRRKWYSIDYEQWLIYSSTIVQKMSHDRSGKKCPIVGQIMSDDSSETSSETSSNTDAPNGARTPSSKKESKPKKREPNPLFDAVAMHIFGIDPAEVNGDGGRVGRISSWLEGKSDGINHGRRKETVGFISAPAEPAHVEKFAAAWKDAHPNTDMPLDFIKFVEAWRKWASQKKANAAKRQSTQTPATPPLTEEQKRELAEARRNIRPVWEQKGEK